MPFSARPLEGPPCPPSCGGSRRAKRPAKRPKNADSRANHNCQKVYHNCQNVHCAEVAVCGIMVSVGGSESLRWDAERTMFKLQTTAMQAPMAPMLCQRESGVSPNFAASFGASFVDSLSIDPVPDRHPSPAVKGAVLLVHRNRRPLSSTVPRSLPFSGRITITGDDYGPRFFPTCPPQCPLIPSAWPATLLITRTFNPQHREGHVC